MECDIENLKVIRQLKMEEQVKQRIRGVLLSAMKNTPVRNENESRLYLNKPLLNSLFRFSMPIAAILLSVCLAGGAALAAENTIPGDTLYPVKIHINENIRSTFTFGAQADANWELEMASRRAHEARQLSEEGGLNAQTQAQMQAQIDANIGSAQSTANLLEIQGQTKAAQKISSDIDAYLQTQAQTLINMGIVIKVDEEMQAKEQTPPQSNSQATTQIQLDTQAATQEKSQVNMSEDTTSQIETTQNAGTSIKVEAAAQN